MSLFPHVHDEKRGQIPCKCGWKMLFELGGSWGRVKGVTAGCRLLGLSRWTEGSTSTCSGDIANERDRSG